MSGIPGVNEKDWKLFRSRIGLWQEAYMDRLNREYIELLSVQEKSVIQVLGSGKEDPRGSEGQRCPGSDEPVKHEVYPDGSSG